MIVDTLRLTFALAVLHIDGGVDNTTPSVKRFLPRLSLNRKEKEKNFVKILSAGDIKKFLHTKLDL